MLLSHLVSFHFVYPDHRDSVPSGLIEMVYRLAAQPKEPHNRICFGTLLSREQAPSRCAATGLHRCLLLPHGTMTPEEIAIWTERQEGLEPRITPTTRIGSLSRFLDSSLFHKSQGPSEQCERARRASHAIERAGEAARERACRGVRGATPSGKKGLRCNMRRSTVCLTTTWLVAAAAMLPLSAEAPQTAAPQQINLAEWLLAASSGGQPRRDGPGGRQTRNQGVGEGGARARLIEGSDFDQGTMR